MGGDAQSALEGLRWQMMNMPGKRLDLAPEELRVGDMQLAIYVLNIFRAQTLLFQI